jgi:hypothetical protein
VCRTVHVAIRSGTEGAGIFRDGFVSAEAMRVAAWSLFLKLTWRRKAMGLFSMGSPLPTCTSLMTELY